jgi:CRP/FNR family transcriptional regulator
MDTMTSSGDSRLPPRLVGLGRRRVVPKGTLLFQQGAPAASCLFVENGEISIRRVSRAGDEVEIAKIGSGEWCGEVILFVESAYPAQAIAVQNATVVEFTRSDILGTPDQEVRTFFLALLANKCLKLNNRIEQLTIMDTRERLVRYIIGLCPGHASGCPGGRTACSFHLPKKKREIAEELGMVPETLSRVLRQLEEEGLIKIDGSRIEIPSCDGLLGMIDDL